MHRLLVLAVFLFSTPIAMGQTLEESVEAHEKAVEEARQKVVEKYNELIIKEEEKGNSEQVGKLREYSQIFINKGVMIVPDGSAGMVAVYKGYGASLKAAGDTLRSAYIQEIKALNDLKEVDRANVLSAELSQRLLPEKLVSFQLAVAPTQYMGHWALLVRGHRPVGEGDRMNATFEMRSGLSNPSYVSIHSVNWPTAFVDHLNFRVRLTDAQDNEGWKQHATWIKTPGLADKDGVSFQAVTHPTRYLRIRPNGEAWLDEYKEDLRFKQESTFYVKNGLSKLW